MATKIIELEGVGMITLVKRAQSRNLRLSITANGVRVSMPRWTSFGTGQAFAESNIDWIQTELARQSRPLLESGKRIGKLHYLRFEHVLGGQPVTSRVTSTEIIVRLRQGELTTDASVQKRAHSAAVRALKREAERLLPPRLQTMAAKHGRQYSSVGIKLLKRRWGSCDSRQAITFNLYLMELPWEYIDYVLLHELAHTVEMNHGPAFWRTLVSMEPQARILGKQLRTHQPAIGAWDNNTP